MKKKKRGIDKRVQTIVGIVCLFFLLGSLGGALAANLLPAEERNTVSVFLQDTAVSLQACSFSALFWKYMKYAVGIWLGGWLEMGLFFAGAVFLFRSLSVGFTSAMMMTTYGTQGIRMAAATFLPQNLLLIPAYSLLMTAAMYYLFSWQEEGKKRGLKRERRRKQTEYCILFGLSILLVAAAAGIEKLLLL